MRASEGRNYSAYAGVCDFSPAEEHRQPQILKFYCARKAGNQAVKEVYMCVPYSFAGKTQFSSTCEGEQLFVIRLPTHTITELFTGRGISTKDSSEVFLSGTVTLMHWSGF